MAATYGWFTVPLTTTAEPAGVDASLQTDVTVPKYHDEVDGFSYYDLGDGTCLARFYADTGTLDTIASDADVTRHADASDAVSVLASSDYPDPQEAAQLRKSLDVGPTPPGDLTYRQDGNFSVDQHTGYQRWIVPENEWEVIDLQDGDVIENVVIDVTNPGANLYVTANDTNLTDWAIRNVAWEGIPTVDENEYGVNLSWAGKFLMSLAGTGTVENVYIDARTPEGVRNDETHIGGGYLSPSHSGHVDVTNTFIAGMGNNAFYGSKPGDDGGGGTISFDDCYHRDNTVSQYRFGTQGCRVRNCVGIVDDPDARRGTYPGYAHSDDSGKNARIVWGRHCDDMVVKDSAFWSWSDDVNPDAAFMSKTESGSICASNVLTIRDCDLNSEAPQVESERAGGTVTLDNLGENPAVDVLIEGVPTSPEMAATGEREIPTYDRA